MGPDSSVTVVLLWAFAALVFVAAVAVGARLGRATPRMVLARGGTIIAASLSLVLAFAGTMNAQYGWYTTWQDLWTSLTGAPAAQTAAVHLGGHALQATPAEARIDRFTNRMYAVERAHFERSGVLGREAGSGGRYLNVHIPGLGPAAGTRAGDVLIWLPSSYTDPTQQHRTYPVIEAFHGIPGSNDAYSMAFSARRLLGNAAAEHRLADTILVAPDFTPSGIDTECVNGAGIDMETWLTRAVPQWVIHHLRVQAAASSWATLGFSAGGWCAAMATVLHPQQFGSAILLGAYYRPIFARQWEPYGHRATPARYDLLTQLLRHRPRVNLWVEISEQDTLSGPGSAQLVQEARAPMSVTSVTLPYAGHRVSVWVSLVPEALTWLGRTSPAFAPAPLAS